MIQPIRIENNNRGYYSYADTVSIIRDIKPNYDIGSLGEKPQSQPPNRKDLTENSKKELKIDENIRKEPTKSENPLQTEEVKLLKDMLNVIQEQLKEKDKQLSIKDQQIKDLSDRLAEVIQLNRGQQYITAADKTTELLEADQQKEDIKNIRFIDKLKLLFR